MICRSLRWRPCACPGLDLVVADAREAAPNDARGSTTIFSPPPRLPVNVFKPLEHAVLIERLVGDRLHHVPVLDDLAILELEDVDDR